MIYCDTSVLVASLTDELHSNAVRNWLETCDQGRLTISAWSAIEFSSAVAIKLRTRQIDAAAHTALLSAWRDLIVPRFDNVSINAADYMRAKAIIDTRASNLRGGDALHLAITSNRGASLATLDHLLSAAAIQIGVAIIEGLT